MFKRLLVATIVSVFAIVGIGQSAAAQSDSTWILQGKTWGREDPFEACALRWSWSSSQPPQWYSFSRDGDGKIYRITCGGNTASIGWVFAKLKCLNGTKRTNDLEFCGRVQPPSCPEGCDQPWGNGLHPANTPRPIHVATGAKLERFTDFVTADGRLAFQRTYTTRGWHLSALGWGWRHNFERNWSASGDEHRLQLGDETVLAYRRNGSGSFSPRGIHSSLFGGSFTGPYPELVEVKGQAHTYELRLLNGNVELYDSARQLMEIRHVGGYTQTLDRSVADQLTVTDSFGRSIVLDFDPEKKLLTSVVQPDGQIFEYEYRSRSSRTWPSGYSSGWAQSFFTLEKVLVPDATPLDPTDNPYALYHYELGGSSSVFMTGITDERGVRVKTIGYDWNRATASEGADGRLRYEAALVTAGQYEVTNSLGKVFEETFGTFNGYFRHLSSTGLATSLSPEVSRTKSFNSGNGHYTGLTDERASQTTWTRNSRGLATQSSYAANSGSPISVQTSWHADFPKPTSITRPRSSSSFSYDTDGNLLSVTHTDTWAGSPARTSSFTYQAGGLVTSIDGPLPGAGDTTSLTYTAEGYLASVTDPNCLVTTITSHDGMGRPQAAQMPGGLSATLTYSLRGWLTSVSLTDGTSTRTTSFAHDAVGNVTLMTLPGGGTYSYTYDGNSWLTSIASSEGETISFTHDNAGNITSRTVSDAGGTQFSSTSVFDDLSRLISSVNATGDAINYAYNAAGDLTSITYPGGHTWSNTFDGLGRILSVTDPQTDTEAYTHDTSSNVTGIQTPAAGGTWQTVTSNMSWKPFGPLVSYDAGNGLLVSRAVDQNYRLTTLQVGAGGTAVLDKTIAYDGASRVTSIVDGLNAANSSSYVYTSDGRMAQAIGPWGDLRWAYDGVGYRLVEDLYNGGGTLLSEADYSYPATSNQLQDIRDGAGTVVRDFTHSGDGNLLTDWDYSAAPDYTYEYDQAGRLSAIRQNGALAATYGHDAFGRRVVRSIAGAGTVHYLFDASGKPLAEHDGATGAVLREYIWLGNLMVGWSDGTGLSFVHGGHLGQPLAMTDGAGAVVWRAEFGPFGELLPSVTTQENDLRFPGQWADGESKLLHNWHRDYDPSLGRYILADPIGLAAGQSLYGYVGGDPIKFVDPMGLDRLVFDGFRLMYEDDDGEIQQSWTAVSGSANGCQCSAESDRPNQGPIPDGSYLVDPSDTNYRQWWKPDWGPERAWGNVRTHIQPLSPTDTFGRRGMYLHGGRDPGSAVVSI